MPEVSVIIPVYNVEQYLSRCLDSVVNQTYKNLEIICVNDCSPDGSSEILKEYALRDNRIKIINRKENGGLSAARNTGLDEASGKYVYFLDSDDWIDLDYIEKMVNIIKKTGVDIVLNTNIIKEFENKSENFIEPNYSKRIEEGEFVLKEDAINKTQCMTWCHIYKKDFLKKYNLNFPEGYIHEDVYFHHASTFYTDKIFAFFGPAYHYLQRKTSIMGNNQNKVLFQYKIFSLVFEFYKNKNSDGIKTIYPMLFHDIQTKEEFKLIKEYQNLIKDEFNLNKNTYNNFEKYLINSFFESETLEDFKLKTGKVPYVTYLTRHKILRQKNIKVSVIIPVFNVEPYLKKCLNSIVNQTLEDIEIICINDCSSDNSLEILQEYTKNDNRIKILDFKENKGASIARNEGIKLAKGEYIGFVDSDDFVNLDFYEKLYKKAKETNSDIVKGLYNTDGQTDNYINDILKTDKNAFIMEFASAIFKADLIKSNNITFPLICDMEDPVFSINVAILANKTEIIDNAFIHITKRNNSATSGIPDEKRIKAKLEGLKLIVNILNNSNNILKNTYASILSYWFVLILADCLRNNSSNVRKILYKNLLSLNNLIQQKEAFLIELSTYSKEYSSALQNNSYEQLSKITPDSIKAAIFLKKIRFNRQNKIKKG